MSETINEKLLKNKKVVEEINRHRWIESEKAGHDVGFETASVDWLQKFSTAWMQYHMPKRKASNGLSESPKTFSAKASPRTKTRTKNK